MKPLVTINLQAPPTLHESLTIADVINAAKTLEQWALSQTLEVKDKPDELHPGDTQTRIS